MSPATTPSPAPVAAPSSKGAKRSLMSSLMDATALLRSSSFKEDSYVAAALPASELRALADLKALVATHPDPISIWGVPLNPHSPPPGAANDADDERADVVLLNRPASPDASGMSPATTPSPAPVAAPSSKGAKRSLMSSLMDATALLRSSSFKEDSYVAAALPASELRALADLKALVATHPDPISIWGVPLNPHSPPPGAANDADDERADVVLLKFLRARDFRALDAHAMLLRCAAWRAEFGTDAVTDACPLPSFP
ncbi:Patellin-6 [Zea mays]|uniref:Patellin-6 n=1 Tax=Zea mays TaxID=4577 RepID=A0A3L6EAZ4_MAIZE|nr:Patellin-6 [Zea mays]